MGNLDRRLLTIEQLLGGWGWEVDDAPSVPTRWERCWPTVTAELADDDYEMLLAYCSQPWDRARTPPSLYYQVSAVISPHSAPDVPLCLPPEVVAVYRSDEHAKPLGDECEDCAYPLPSHQVGWGNYPPRARSYFTTCPICGGTVARNAYRIKHGWQTPVPGLPVPEAG